jgi:hypothetical protein
MVATFNGWDELPEAEREGLEQWEQEPTMGAHDLGREPRASGSHQLDGLKIVAHL